MTTQSQCLPAEKLIALLQGDIDPAESEHWERHVTDCPSCQTTMANHVADPQWWKDAETSLGPDQREAFEAARDGSAFTLAESQGQESSSQFADLLRYLGPTDDPRMMGRIGAYEVMGILGRGGMGIVFKAFDSALNRYVAIKMLLPHLSELGAARQRFRREGQAAAAVVDDHVLPIYAVDEWQGIPYLVMQYCKGSNLQARLDSEGPLEPKEILRIGIQTARGLAAAHAQGLVHRDVKPSNILQDGAVERVMITDFGLARAVDDVTITRTGTIAGTPQYMSPEQARGRPVESTSDLFGLGSVLYALCTGKPPFRADNSYAVLRQITDENAMDIQEFNTDIPSWLCRIIEKLMSKTPEDRYTSATEVADLLEECLAHMQHPSKSPLPRELLVDRQSQHRKAFAKSGSSWSTAKRILVGAALGLCAIVAGVFIILELNKGTLEIKLTDGVDVPIVIRQNDQAVKRLTVSQDGARIRLFAGQYEIEFEEPDGNLTLDHDRLMLQRGAKVIVEVQHNPSYQASAHEQIAQDPLNYETEKRQYLVWESNDQVRLSHWFAKTLKLSNAQLQSLNELLTNSWNSYIKLESESLDFSATAEASYKSSLGRIRIAHS